MDLLRAAELLEPHFARGERFLQGPTSEWARRLGRHRARFPRATREVVFFGVFKAGKSTLLNALLGADLLPTRTLRATGVVTRLVHRPHGSARLLEHTEGSGRWREVSLEEARRQLLLETDYSAPANPREIDCAELGLPLPWLASGGTLVDTPGLDDEPRLTRRTLETLAEADLAVMVLAADKLLSEHEREAARKVHEALGGNVVFLLNRLAQVDEEERAQVQAWALRALRGYGNALIGKPRLFTVCADLSRSEVRLAAMRQDEGLREFASWLWRMLTEDMGERVALLSRLRLLSEELIQVAGLTMQQLTRIEAQLANSTGWQGAVEAGEGLLTRVREFQQWQQALSDLVSRLIAEVES